MIGVNTDICITVEMIGESGMTPSSVIIIMEMSGLTPIIHHFHSNAYIVNVEMIGENYYILSYIQIL